MKGNLLAFVLGILAIQSFFLLDLLAEASNPVKPNFIYKNKSYMQT